MFISSSDISSSKVSSSDKAAAAPPSLRATSDVTDIRSIASRAHCGRRGPPVPAAAASALCACAVPGAKLSPAALSLRKLRAMASKAIAAS